MNTVQVEETLARDRSYPIARYTNLIWGRRFAAWAVDQPFMTPDRLTTWSLWIGLGSAFCFAQEWWWSGILALQVHITLDRADGHLARLRDCQTTSGKWWDGLVNRVVEGAVYLGMTWCSMHHRESFARMAMAGGLTVFGLFMVDYQNMLQRWAGIRFSTPVEEGAASPLPLWERDGVRGRVVGWLKEIYGFLEKWDVRLWLVCLAAGIHRLDWLLVYFAVDFNFRWMYNAAKVTWLRSDEPAK